LDLLVLRFRQVVSANCSVATPGFVYNRQTRRLVCVEFAPGFFQGFIHAAAGGRGTHNLLNRNFRRPPIIGCHVVTHVAFGHDSHEATVLLVVHNGRAPASRLAHRLRGML
jgi:hypothetical protein